MYEVRLHGRGGQGAVMAAGMLASALVAEDKFAVCRKGGAGNNTGRNKRQERKAEEAFLHYSTDKTRQLPLRILQACCALLRERPESLAL